MTAINFAKDVLWPRANTLFKPNLKQADIALLGFPVHKSSITPNSCHLAPKAIRSALARYSTYSASNDVDLRELKITDLGDVTGADSSNGKKVIAKKVSGLLERYGLLIALGGDNSITYTVASGLFGDLSKVGKVTAGFIWQCYTGKDIGCCTIVISELCIQPVVQKFYIKTNIKTTHCFPTQIRVGNV